jgi:hypothetical protein
MASNLVGGSAVASSRTMPVTVRSPKIEEMIELAAALIFRKKCLLLHSTPPLRAPAGSAHGRRREHAP